MNTIITLSKIGNWIHFPIGCSTFSHIIYQDVFEFLFLTAVPYYFVFLSELLSVTSAPKFFTYHVILFVILSGTIVLEFLNLSRSSTVETVLLCDKLNVFSKQIQ
jgi:hypothetical protein